MKTTSRTLIIHIFSPLAYASLGTFPTVSANLDGELALDEDQLRPV
jgi:hypothetical protein